MDTADRYITQSVGVVTGYIFICFHENLLDADHAAPYGTYPDIFLFVFINTFDGVYRQSTHVSRRMHDSGNIGRMIHIHDIDASSVGRDPKFIVYLHEIEDQVRV